MCRLVSFVCIVKDSRSSFDISSQQAIKPLLNTLLLFLFFATANLTGHTEKISVDSFDLLKVLGTGGKVNENKFTCYICCIFGTFAVIIRPHSPSHRSFFDRVLFDIAYGKVYLVKKKDGFHKGKLFAMKVLKKATIVQKAKTTEHTMTERQVLEAVRSCPFLVTLHWAFQTDSKLHLVMGKSRLLRFSALGICWNALTLQKTIF